MTDPRHSFPFPAIADDLVKDTGVLPDRVESECRSLLQDYLKHSPSRSVPERVDKAKTLVIQTANHPWEVVDQHNLTELIDPDLATLLLYMPLGYQIHTADLVANWPQCLSCTGSPEALVSAICKTDAGTAYLKVSPHTKSEFLIPLILILRPDISLVIEFYDMGALFSRALLENSNGYSEAEINMTRFAAFMAAKNATALVVKSTGVDWTRLSQSCDALTFSWFPMQQRLLDATWTNAPRTWVSGTHTVAFAGSLGDTELTRSRDVAPGANFIETLALLMSDPGCTVAMFNAADRREGAGPSERFQRVEDWFTAQGKRHRYSPAIDEEQLIRELEPLDFGFFCVHYPDQPVEHVGRLAIPNRVMAYLCAGLPIIVDAYAEAMADLVGRFNAGIVIDPSKYETLPARISCADNDQMRAGVQALRDHILKHNTKILEDLRQVLPSKNSAA